MRTLILGFALLLVLSAGAFAQSPGVDSVVVSSASGNFYTTEDLTCHYVLTGPATTAASAWYRDGSPFAAVYLPFEGGPTSALLDYSGNGLAVSDSGAPVWNAAGGFDGNGAFELDGTADYLVVPDGPVVDLDYVTLSAWIYVDSVVNDPRIISKEFGTTEPFSIYTLLINSSTNRLELRLGLEGQTRHILTGNTVIPVNTWVHVAGTFDGSQAILYVNGAPDTNSSPSGVIRKNDRPVYIGASEFYGRYFDGRIDDARVYGFALSADQVAALYNSGADVIAAAESNIGEQWFAAVTPFSTSEAGTAVNSDTVTITAPSIPPTIVSVPETTATALQLYTYDVDADGYPSPTYSLTTSPAGMSIDSLSGVIQWTPVAAGTVPVSVEASNIHGTDTQNFNIVVTGVPSGDGVVDHVVIFSIDGLNPGALTDIPAGEIPNLTTVRQKAYTLNARTPYTHTNTLPCHTSILTGRPVEGTLGHQWTGNSMPTPTQTLHNNHPTESYVYGVYDVAHDNGLRTSMFASKDKFILFQQSWPDKIDNYVYSTDVATTLVNGVISELNGAAGSSSLTFMLDYRTDDAGHSGGWDWSDPSEPYYQAVLDADDALGQILDAIRGNPELVNNTAVIVVTDHGGTGTSHDDPTDPQNYTIPLMVWLGDDHAGGELYGLNSETRVDPGTGRPLDPPAPDQPIRNADVANLALDLLGLPAVPNSAHNTDQDLEVTAITTTVVSENFESGFTAGAQLRTHPDWFYEDINDGPTILATGGVNGSVGLSNGDRAFTWVAHPFTWSDEDVKGVYFQADYQTDASGVFDDDRLGWTISDTDDSSDWIFGVQMDPEGATTTYNIECYWDGDAFGDDGGRTSIVELPALSGNTWYRLYGEFTKLSATSARIDVSLTELDASGDEVGVVATGTIADTDGVPGGTDNEPPNAGYFTASTMWPLYKNYNAVDGHFDNAVFGVITEYTPQVNTPPDQPVLNAPADSAVAVPTPPTLDVTVTDADGDSLTVVFYGQAAPPLVPESQRGVDRTPAAFQEIGTNTGVTSGSRTTVEWPDLEPVTEYQWYVTVADSDTTITGPTWTFTTADTTMIYSINVSTVGAGSVTLDPNQALYALDDSVTLTATPAGGWVFSGWSGDLIGAENPDTLVVTGDMNVTATFFNPVSGDTLRFAAFGDYGSAGPNEAAVASLVFSHTPDIIITTGDNSYGANPIDVNIGQYYSDYIGNYVGSYGTGSVPNRLFPALGNHDISDGGGLAAYLSYFTLPDSGVLDTSTSGNERYYDYVRGPVHFFAIDSDPSEVDGRDSTSTQAQWLKAQLAASTSPWQVVHFHHPPYSSSTTHGSELVMRWPFEAWGADVTFAGHDHVYERLLVDQDGDGETIPYFITGAGGRSLYPFGTPLPESVVRYSSDYGTMIVEATDTYMNFKFYSINPSHGTAGLIDEYTITREVEEPGWVAYNDCVYDAGLAGAGTDPNGQSVHYLGTNVTAFGIGSGFTGSSSGELIKQTNGDATGVTVTVSQSGDVVWQPDVSTNWYGGYDCAEGTDARTTFGGIADMTGVVYYGTTAAWYVDLTFAGLDPAKKYTFATSASRAEAHTNGAPGYDDRWTIYTISGVDSATNASTAGTQEYLGDPLRVWFCTGNNHDEGYVARWTDIEPGSDGTFVVRAEPHPSSNDGGRKAYAFDVFMLQEGVVIVSPPSAPVALGATAVSHGEIDLAWTDTSDNETGFEIARSQGGGPFDSLTTVAADVETYSDMSVAAETRYCYRVRAVNGAGESAWTSEACDSTPEPPVGWVAYNDLNPHSGDQNALYVTEWDYNAVGGALVDSASGGILPVTITGTIVGGYDPDHPTNGGQCNGGTEAGDWFGPSGGVIVDLQNTIELDDAGWANIVTFEHLNPGKLYQITLSANRDNPDYAGQRYARVTIEGTTLRTNTSSAGVVVNADTSVSFSVGYNTVNGYVAQWSGVGVGTDSSFSVRSVWDTGYAGTKGYAMTAFRLEEVDTTLGYPVAVTVEGAGSVTKNPDKALYEVDEAVELTAVPDSGWEFVGWSGDLTGSENPDTLVVTGDMAVTAGFAEITTLTCEDYESGFTLGQTVGSHADWYDGGNGPVVTAGVGVNGSVGLAPANNIFTWISEGFDWNDPDFDWVVFEMDFESNSEGVGDMFNDDRVGWMIYDDDISSDHIFGVQFDDSDNKIEGYWDGVTGSDKRPLITTWSPKRDTWYRLWVKVTKLTATSARLDVTVDELASDGTVAVADVAGGTIADTDLLGDDVPDTKYFTASQIWPGYKNYNSSADGAVDNACYEVKLTPTYTVVATADPDTAGSVTLLPDLAQYAAGDTVVVTAVPGTGWVFSGWSGDLAGTDNPDTLIVTGDMTVTAHFVRLYTLTTNTVGSGVVTRTPDLAQYVAGDTVIVTAVPDEDWVFDAWTGGLTGSENPDTVVMVSDTTVTAHFVQAYTLTANAVGNGVVTKTPDLSAYFLGDTVIVTAVPDEGWVFDAWTSGLTGSENPDTVIMSSDTTVTASFTAIPYALTTNVEGQGSITLEPDQATYVFGDTVIVTAVPDSAWEFDTWSDGLTGSENPDTLVMVSDTAVTAHFKLAPTGVGDGVPRQTALFQNRPNPFNPTTTIEYALAVGGPVSLRIYDVTGRLVRTLVHGEKPPGVYAQQWDGRNDHGHPVATGVYIYQLRAGDMVFTRKAVLLK